MTGIFIDFVLFDLIQINYRDFLQSPLQVSPVVFAIDSTVPKTNYSWVMGWVIYTAPKTIMRG